MKIISVTYNDPGISWGPAIHFLELWSGVAILHPEVQVAGFAPSWTGNTPILPVHFPLTRFRVPAIAKGRQVLYDLMVAWRVVLRADASDVVYLRLSQFHLFSTLALHWRRNQLVLELNGLLLDDAVSARRSRLMRSFVRWQEGALVRRAGGLISVSQGISDTIRATYRPTGELITLKNGVGMHFFEDCAPTPSTSQRGEPQVTILYVGTFTPWDGAARIVELARHFPEVNFAFVGDGPARKAVQTQATPNMTFVGRVAYADLPQHYRRAQAGIVLYEIQRHQRVHLSSLKTLEYLASGLPVFTTSVPGQEIVAELGCGVLSKGEDLVEDFRKFLHHLASYRSRAQAARAVMRRDHSWQSVADKTISFIRRLKPMTVRP
jgi:glycosyltransferase involved in cell wall biosynthesis